jgi:hypothetical protein
MITPLRRQMVSWLLVFLVILDIVLSTLTLAFPETWFRIFHAAPYVDPQGLLQRTGALWVAFTILQAMAYFKWESRPYWLVLIAGVRFTELFSDWTYLFVAENVTILGGLGLFIAPPGNLIFGLFLLNTYLRMQPVAGAGVAVSR